MISIVNQLNTAAGIDHQFSTEQGLYLSIPSQHFNCSRIWAKCVSELKTCHFHFSNESKSQLNFTLPKMLKWDSCCSLCVVVCIQCYLCVSSPSPSRSRCFNRPLISSTTCFLQFLTAALLDTSRASSLTSSSVRILAKWAQLSRPLRPISRATSWQRAPLTYRRSIQFSLSVFYCQLSLICFMVFIVSEHFPPK